MEAPTISKEVAVEVPKKIVRNEEQVQCNWNFVSNEDGVLEAINAITGRVFKGSREEFREILKGN